VTVFDRRGLMVGDALQCPPAKLIPLMPRAQLARVEVKLWERTIENLYMPLSDTTAYQNAGISACGWSVHHIGEDHAATADYLVRACLAYGLTSLNLNLEAGWFVEREQGTDPYPPCFKETEVLLAAVRNTLGSGFPLAVTLIPAKLYAFEIFLTAGVHLFFEEYDGAGQPLQQLDYQRALTYELTDAIGIPRAQVHRCVSKVQLPAEGPILVFTANVMDDSDYR
jgi:hypothetical protein